MTTSAIDHEVAPDDSVTTPIKRKAMLEMRLTEAVALVESLRDRRFALKTFIQRARNANSTKKQESLYNKCEISINKLATSLLKIDGSLDKADDSVNKIRIMLLEMGELLTKDNQ